MKRLRPKLGLTPSTPYLRTILFRMLWFAAGVTVGWHAFEAKIRYSPHSSASQPEWSKAPPVVTVNETITTETVTNNVGTLDDRTLPDSQTP